MGFQHRNIKTLTDLGLDRSMARVYLALHRTGTAKATTIAQLSGVARPDVYRALSKLQKFGLVEKILANPLKFKPIPLENGVTILLERKTKELNELKVKSASLIHTLNKKTYYKNSFQESQFVLVPSKEILIKRLKKNYKKNSNEYRCCYYMEKIQIRLLSIK